MKLTRFLGRHVQELLDTPPISDWEFRREVDTDLPTTRIQYEFEDRHFDVLCDEDESVGTIFLQPGVDPEFCPVPFSTTRSGAIAHFGAPSSSGESSSHPVLGEFGPHDRFTLSDATVHLEYSVQEDQIRLITLIHTGSALDPSAAD